MATFKLKNISGIDGNWAGQDILADEVYVVDPAELESFRIDNELFIAVANSELEVEVDNKAFSNAVEGWLVFSGDNLPKSELDGKKLAVHTSYKPTIPGISTYAVWTGAGDDVENGIVGEGDLLHFHMNAGQATTEKEVRFLASAGRVWIHEGYLKFTGAGEGDYIEADIVAPPSALQQLANLDLIVEDDEVKPAPGGAGTGTHGFAAAPALIPRKFSKNGFWDWDFENEILLPNPLGTGSYAMYVTEQITHRYINKIPCYGECNTYFSMSSDETSELFQPYFLRLRVHNNSNTEWHASVLLEIYRERTI